MKRGGLFAAGDRAVDGVDDALNLDKFDAGALRLVAVEGRGEDLRMGVAVLDHAIACLLQRILPLTHVGLPAGTGPLLFRNDGNGPSRGGAGFEFHDRSDQAPNRYAAHLQGGRHPSELSEATTPRFGHLGCLNRLHGTPLLSDARRACIRRHASDRWLTNATRVEGRDRTRSCTACARHADDVKPTLRIESSGLNLPPRSNPQALMTMANSRRNCGCLLYT